MKITDSETIKSSEKELIDAITGDLDWQAIEQLFREKYHLGLQDEIEYRKGDLVVHNEQIAYRLEFDVKVALSVLFDRKGECIEVTAVDRQGDSAYSDEDRKSETVQDDPGAEANGDPANQQVSQMASQIAEMMTEINKD
ncbi:MAG: hypothetical protein ACOZF0_12750 [Thermodesulfobacteriota bacterium]